MQQENKDNHHLQIINQDFLQSDLLKIKQDYKANKIVANLPYSVASLIIIKIFTIPNCFYKNYLHGTKGNGNATNGSSGW